MLVPLCPRAESISPDHCPRRQAYGPAGMAFARIATYDGDNLLFLALAQRTSEFDTLLIWPIFVSRVGKNVRAEWIL